MTAIVSRRTIAALVMVMIVLGALGALTITPGSAQITATNHVLKVIDETPFVGPTGEFRIAFSTSDLPPTTRLSLTIHSSIPNRSRLDRTIAGEQLGTALFSTPTRSIAELTQGASAVLALPISDVWPAPENGTVLSEAGVYPVMITATDAGGDRVDSIVTHLIRLPRAGTPTTPLAVGTVVPIDSTPVVAIDGAPVLSDSEGQRVSKLLTLVNAPISTPPLTLAATPFVIQTLAENGATESLRANITDRQTLLRTYVGIDSGSLVAADLARVIDEELVAGSQVLASAFEVQPDASVTVIDDTVTPSSLDRFAVAGTKSVVIPSRQIRASLTNGESSVITRRFAIQSGDGTTFAAITSDDATTDRFIVTEDPVLAAHHALAELSMLHFEQPGAGRGVAVALPSGITPAALEEFLSGLWSRAGESSGSVGQPIVDPTTIDDLLIRTDAATEQGRTVERQWTSAEPAGLGSFPVRFEAAQWNLNGLRSTLPGDTEFTGPIDHEILSSAARGLTLDSQDEILDHADRRITAIGDQISLPQSQNVTLTSSSGKIPLVLTNSLPVEAHVRVKVTSAKLEFPEGNVLDMVLAPSGTTRTDIEVTTRASGAFPLDISVSSADGALPLTTSRYNVRSTAISGWGLVLSIGAGLFLLLWWARHWRTSRRSDLVVEDEPSTPTDG